MTRVPANDGRIPLAARAAPAPRGRRLGDALRILAAAPLPDEQFGDDLDAIRASAGMTPPDPWELS